MVRAAREGDDAALARIDLATWNTSPAPPPPAGDSRGFLDGTSPGDVLVAESAGVVLGYVQLRAGFDIPSHRHVLQICGLAVDPPRQGAGVGRLLVVAAVEAQRRGAGKLTLRVLAPNRAARRLYERCGFEVEGVLRAEFFLDERYVEDVLMALHLEGIADGSDGA